MKSTDRNLFACEQEQERRSVLASEAVSECKQEESDKEADDQAFWKVVYILVHVAAVALVLFTLIHFGSK